jgi:predicted RecB family nuclease
MRLTASDFITYFRPSQCELRVWLRHRGEEESEPSVYDEVLRRLGERHEREHLATLGPYLDLRQVGEEERIQRTLEAINEKVPVLYQPAFRVMHQCGPIEAEIIGIPDFLIRGEGGYVIRDSKMSRRIDEKNHPEILLQVQLYGWLFEKTCGVPPTDLQVFSGTKEIVAVPYDGGKSALEGLERLATIKQREGEAYEPVGWSKCTPCGFTDRCWARAEAADDPALLPDVDQSLARKLNHMGIHTRRDLLAKFDFVSLSGLKRPFGNREQRVGEKAEHILQFAEVMEERKPRILATPAIPQHPNYVMFDLEGMPPHLDELDKIYLWGAQVFGEKPSAFMPAVSGFGPDGDREGWLAFLENAKQIFALYGDIPFVHWATYEKTHLLKYIQKYGDIDATAARVKANLLNLLTVARDSLILPVPSFSLKVIEQYVGYKRKQEEYGGQWAMAKFIEATETEDEEQRRKVMAEILAYNKEDLEATWAVFQWVKSAGAGHK